MMARRSWPADIVLGTWSIVKGLTVTILHLGRPRVTENYPAQPTRICPRYRGRLQHLRDDEGRLKCTACLACQKACPTIALPQIEGDDKKGREKRAKTYVWDSGRCLFCGYCVEACPFDAIRLTQVYSVVGVSRDELRIELDGLLEPATQPAGTPKGGAQA